MLLSLFVFKSSVFIIDHFKNKPLYLFPSELIALYLASGLMCCLQLNTLHISMSLYNM